MPFELIPPGTHIDFIGKRRICGVLSLLLLGAGILAIPLRGVQLGIDFAGGTEVQVRFPEGVPVSEGPIRDVVTACGIDEPDVVRYGDGAREYLVRFRAEAEPLPAEPGDDPCPVTAEQREGLRERLEAAGGEDVTGQLVERLALAMENAIGPLEIQRVEFVGPRVGEALRSDGLWALGIACVLILAYIAFRFSTSFAPGAVVALVHDVGITAGLFVIFGLEFDLRVLAALLAIIGYSLNDTIIIYDRIRENMELRTKQNLLEVLNRSVNQTLSRTILTSGTTLAAVLALLLTGGEVIRPFAIAMVIGVVVGTYSSVFIAAPTLLLMERRLAGEEGSGARPARSAQPPRRPKPGKGGKAAGARR